MFQSAERNFSCSLRHNVHIRRSWSLSSITTLSYNQQARYEYHSKSILLQSNQSIRSKEENLLKPQITPVIIVGGGPVGLFLSILLSDYNVPHILLERQSVASRFRHPQAHFINTRSMELFRTVVPDTTNTPPSSLLERIQSAMSPVRHWQSFRYGTAIHDHDPLAEIIHPVDRPLQSNCDANGVLSQPTPTERTTTHSNGTTTTTTTTATTFDLSPCTVGHLAQHTLGRILYDTALEKCQRHSQDSTMKSQILYDTSVERMEWITHNGVGVEASSSPMLRVVTKPQNNPDDPCHEYISDLVIAADGAHSTVRQRLWPRTDRATSNDDQVEQHLINVHVTIPKDIANEIHTKHNNYAMLYSVYTSDIIAMIVCHTIGEYVIQIPYFPPYQTVEDDFSLDQVVSYMDVIFGYPNIAKECHIHSIAPWTMKSWIASQYYQLSMSSSSSSPRAFHRAAAGVVLVGDAAHVFPPAGGFGMNTGLQDAHNIAWKIAAYRNSTVSSSSVTSEGQLRWTLPEILKSYEQERRPIAQQNAALSIRNYERLLEVTKTLYLNAQHPALLCTLLDHSPLPLSVRQGIFRTLLKTALFPLSWLRSKTTLERSDSTFLKSNNEWLSYAKHIRSNLRQILQDGAGLPLLFPRYEIGFTYNLDANAPTHSPPANTNDTIPDIPHLAVGRLVPHTCVHVISDNARLFPNLKHVQFGEASTSSTHPESPMISTTDLPAQMKNATETNPIFVLLYVSTKRAVPMNEAISLCALLCQAVRNKIGGLQVRFAIVDRDENHTNGRPNESYPVAHSEYLILAESTLEQQAFSFSTAFSSQHPYYVLIRPDGHIAGIATIPTREKYSEPTTQQVIDKLLQKII